MSYFMSPQAEYKAKRITQMLAPEVAIAAQRDGRVICNMDGHIHLFSLDENQNLVLVTSVDVVIPTSPATTIVLG